MEFHIRDQQSSTQDVNHQSKSDILANNGIHRFLVDESRVFSRSHDASVHITAAKKRMSNKMQEFDIAFTPETETGNS